MEGRTHQNHAPKCTKLTNISVELLENVVFHKTNMHFCGLNRESGLIVGKNANGLGNPSIFAKVWGISAEKRDFGTLWWLEQHRRQTQWACFDGHKVQVLLFEHPESQWLIFDPNCWKNTQNCQILVIPVFPKLWRAISRPTWESPKKIFF